MNPSQLSGGAAPRRSHASGAFNRALRHYGGIVVGLIVLCGFFWALSPNFMSVNNLLNVVMQVSIIAILGFGMTYVLLLGDIDLSVGATMALVGTVCAFALEHGASPFLAVLAAMGTGLVLGAINGSLSALLTIPSFIVTVATMGVFRGFAYLTSNGVPISIDNDAFAFLGNGAVLGIPLPIWILAVLLLLNHFVLSRTVFGRKAYLAGGNREAALYSGIDVNRLRIMIFMISGLLASIGGVLMTSRLYSAQPNAGIGYELDAIAAAVLGGTSLSGGYGTITGTLIGALIIGVINNGMNLLSVPYFYQLIVKGIVILVAVCIDVQTKKRHA
ncbi:MULTISPECIES: ABC transporter permease [Burkholderiaceae]|jgi:ribose transport system permease protein|uniref:Ribose ABC transport system, permease protein RbsC n=1 Tax=Caballeronia sordidicola TaxID=196367 RepID=A0A242MG95_CABSO|nr:MULTISPECIES: ABC transporter permease [Burkholderiaceae]AMM13221.1 ribose ABC transporter permease [Burkholderia sp. PAMC 28687]MDP9153578.1 ABC transporter permease [Pseudomonadota bacterium]OTP70207.1 Ribose ABC transport system, permease protein RbsC [Caballeronia sordidicola]OTP71381.1 Ribose ABC transport system, permease protein RbsC [Caballeronia sordidicola]